MCCPHELSKRTTRKASNDFEQLIWECVECGTEMKAEYLPDPVDGQMFRHWRPIGLGDPYGGW